MARVIFGTCLHQKYMCCLCEDLTEYSVSYLVRLILKERKEFIKLVFGLTLPLNSANRFLNCNNIYSSIHTEIFCVT